MDELNVDRQPANEQQLRQGAGAGGMGDCRGAAGDCREVAEDCRGAAGDCWVPARDCRKLQSYCT